MRPIPRHQCLIYQGSSARHLTILSTIVRQKLRRNIRCVYLNSALMVANMKSSLAAAGVDVPRELSNSSLILSSERPHLAQGRCFDIDRMIDSLQSALQQALADGYKGLWATGDMTWEFGPDKDFSCLVEYERRLEEVFHKHSELGGICQYNATSLPHEALCKGLVSHPAVCINETLSRVNPHYLSPLRYTPEAVAAPALDSTLAALACA